jgi:hypothetical protein
MKEEKARAEEGAAVTVLGARRGDAAGASERELGVAGERKGKLTGGSRPSAAPGGKEARRRDGSRRWAGPVALGRFARGEKKGKKGKADGLGSRGWWAGGPLGGVRVYSFGFEFDWPNPIQIPHI